MAGSTATAPDETTEIEAGAVIRRRRPPPRRRRGPERMGRAAALIAAAALAGCTAPPAPPVRVGTYASWPGYEPLFLARDLGYLDEGAVRLVDYWDGGQAIGAFRNRVVEVATVTLDEALILRQDVPSVRVVLVLDVSHGADVILGRPGIETMADLRGKRVCAETTGLGGFVLARAAELAGLSLAEVTILHAGFAEHERTFLEGRADAVVTFEPVRSHLLAAGARLLFDSTRIPGEILDVLVVREEVLASRTETLETVAKAWYAALDFRRGNPEDAGRRAAPRLGLSPEHVAAAHAGLRLADREENRRMLSGPRPLVAETARRLAAFMNARDLLRADVSLESLADPRIAVAAAPGSH